MKHLITSAIVLSLAVSLNAQEIPERKSEHPRMHQGGHPKMNRHHGRHEMMKQLNLSDDQKEKMKAGREEFRKKMEELKKNDNITVKEWRSRMESLKKEQKTRFENLLTADQKAKMEQLKQEGHAKREQMGKKHFERMKTELGLSQEQTAKLEQQKAEMDQQLKAIRENKNLSDEQRREQVKELMKKRRENMKSVLTEEQRSKLKEQRPHHRPERGDKRPVEKQTI